MTNDCVRFCRNMMATAAGIIALTALTACSPTPAPPPAPLTYDQLKAKVSDHAVITMVKSDYHTTYARLGARQFAKANALMPWAAIAAAQYDACDEVDLVDVSDLATRRELQWFVDCTNRARFQITQGQAEAAKQRFEPSK